MPQIPLSGNNTPASSLILRWLPLALAFLSGAAGVAHQLLWTRRLVDLLGGTSLTFSRVTGAFFLGLALGAGAAALFRPSKNKAWAWVAAVELGVALLSIPVMESHRLVSLASLGGFVREGLQWIAPLLLVLPPAAAMGLVIPWMINALPEDSVRRKNIVLGLYTSNTFGGFTGVLWVVGIGLSYLGMTGSSLTAAALNLLVCVGALYLSKVHHQAQETASLPEPAGDEPLPAKRVPRAVWGLGFISGFAVLGMEVLVQHQLAQVSINSLFSNAAVLSWVLLGLAAAGLAAQQILRRLNAPGKLLLPAGLVAAATCAAQPLIFSSMRSGVDSLSYEMLPGRYFWELSLLSFCTIFPLFLVCGLLFPTLMRLVEEFTGANRARHIAALLAWNGLGGWLGTELTQHGISRVAGLWVGMPVIGLLYLAAASVRLESVRNTEHSTKAILPKWLPIGAVALLVGVCALSFRSLPHVRLENGEKLLEYRVGPEGVVAAVERAPGDRRLLLNNTYSLGGTSAQFNQERQAHIPLLLHGSAKRVGVLGIATGSTLAGASLHPGLEQVKAAELSHAVLDFAHTHFSPWVRGVFERTNVTVAVEDARWLIAGQRGSMDVIVGDLFLPWRTGEGRMFTREHFESVRAALKPEGIFCQWLPMFQLTREQYDTICRTFLAVFPEAFLVRGDFYTELPILGLVGGRSVSQLDWHRIGEACARLRGNSQVTDPIARHAEGIAMMVIGPVPPPPAGTINTLANLRLELDAGRNVVGLQKPWFIGIPCAEYVRDIQRASQMLIPEELRSAHDAGQFFLTLEISAKLNLPVTRNMMSQVPWRLPRALSTDAAADWKHWPMRVKPQPTIEHRSASLNRTSPTSLHLPL